MWASYVGYLFFLSINTIKAYKIRRPAFAYPSDRKVLHQVAQFSKRLEKTLKHNSRVDCISQPKASASQPEHPAGAICSTHEGTPARHGAAPCTEPGFGIAAWLQMMLWTAEKAVRAPREGHVSGNVYFPPLAMGLLGLIFFLHSNPYNTHCKIKSFFS